MMKMNKRISVLILLSVYQSSQKICTEALSFPPSSLKSYKDLAPTTVMCDIVQAENEEWITNHILSHVAEDIMPRMDKNNKKLQVMRSKRIRNDARTTSPPSKSKTVTKVSPINPRFSEKRHSANDWFHNICTLKESSVLEQIKQPVLAISLWSTLVSVLYHVLPSHLGAKMALPAGPHSLLTSALGLLLVFKTNSAYGRFTEGVKIWEQITSTSRNFSRMLKLYENEIGSDNRRKLQYLLASFPYLLRYRINPQCVCEDDSSNSSDDPNLMLLQEEILSNDTRYDGSKAPPVMNIVQYRSCRVDKRALPWRLLGSEVLSERTLEVCVKARNRPLWCVDRMSRILMEVPYGANFQSRERLTLLGHLDKLSHKIGECERIHQTCVPVNYARHSLRSLTFWLLTLPFVLINDLKFKTGPIMAVIAWILFGVYQIGYQIEDPFQGSIRLSIICDNIRRDVLGDTDMRDTAFALPADDEIGKNQNLIQQEKEVNGSNTDGFCVSVFEQKEAGTNSPYVNMAP